VSISRPLYTSTRAHTRKRGSRRIASVLALLLVVSACSTITRNIETITLLTYEGFTIPQESLDAYTERTGIRVAVIREPDAAAVVELLSRTSENPIADVVVGIDSLSVARVLRERLVSPHGAIEADRLDPSLLVENDQLTPISYLDVCLNVDLTAYAPPPPTEDELAEIAAEATRAAAEAAEGNETGGQTADADLAPVLPDAPGTLLALADPVYANSLVIPDPATDRMGQYFIVALHHRFGDGSIDEDGVADEGWVTVARRLVANGLTVEPTWRDAYFGAFTQGSATGTNTVVVASAQMPAVTARLRFDPPERLETTAINDACVRVVSYAGVVTGADDQRAAGRLIDQMISPEFQFGVGDTMGSRPARADLIIPDLIEQYGLDVDVATIDPQTDGDELAKWIGIWGLIMDDAAEAALTGANDDADSEQAPAHDDEPSP